MLRSHQFLTQTNGTFSNQNSSTYLQRTFTDLKTLMRAGEVNLNNSVLEGASIYGIEIALTTHCKPAAVVCKLLV